MPNTRKLPAGKEQFGIIIPAEIHADAKHLSADLGCRISGVYELGIRTLMSARQMAKDPEAMQLIGEVTSGVPKADWDLLRALAAFLRDNTDKHNRGMLELLLDRYKPGKMVSMEVAAAAEKRA